MPSPTCGPSSVAEAGLVPAGFEVKVLGTGSLDRKLTVEAHAFSSSAREAIEARGGSVKVIGEPRKIGPKRLAAKTAKRTPKAEEPETSPRSGEEVAPAKRARQVGGSEEPKTEQSRPTTEE